MQLIVITGLSGAARSSGAPFRRFRLFLRDNLPPSLLAFIRRLLERGKIGKAALVMDARGGRVFPEMLAALDEISQSPLDCGFCFSIATMMP
jgi:RNase adaptor protein for sRNA GlmZ degradation